MNRDELIATVERAVNLAGGKPYPIERRAGLPEDSIRNILKGREPGVFRMSRVCSALGLEFYIGPPREDLLALTESTASYASPSGGASRHAEVGSGMPAVTDRSIAEAVAALADAYEQHNDYGRDALLIRFWEAHPDLRRSISSSPGRRLSWLARH